MKCKISWRVNTYSINTS